MWDILIFLPLIGSFVILCINKKTYFLIGIVALWFVISTFFFAETLWDGFNPVEFHVVLPFWPLNINYRWEVDSISLMFYVWTLYILPWWVLADWSNIRLYFKGYLITLLIVMESLNIMTSFQLIYLKIIC